MLLILLSGCPCDLDPMVTAHELAKEQIAVYTVGCEPSLSPYKEWFMAISHITSGQYLPLASANVVAQVSAHICYKLIRFKLEDMKKLI
jgi:hypothetical protein